MIGGAPRLPRRRADTGVLPRGAKVAFAGGGALNDSDDLRLDRQFL